FVEKNNRTYTVEVRNTAQRLRHLKDRLQTMYGYQNPVERVVCDERLNLLEQQFNKFIYEINPHHLQPGLVLDVDISTSKRKQYMMKGMANVLNEFLHGVSKGFADAAFATFKRRRSTVRDDSEMAFGEITEDAHHKAISTQYASQTVESSSSSSSSSSPEPYSPPSLPSEPASSQESGVRGSADVTPKSYDDKLKDMGLKEL
ncbi:MAG: cytochrome C oxidase subunit II, partial [Spirochaetae bacterium HGW-Spirochaetae-10]